MAKYYTNNWPNDKAKVQPSKFSASICAKVPEQRKHSTPANARWILRQIDITPLEKKELLALARSDMQ